MFFLRNNVACQLRRIRSWKVLLAKLTLMAPLVVNCRLLFFLFLQVFLLLLVSSFFQNSWFSVVAQEFDKEIFYIERERWNNWPINYAVMNGQYCWLSELCGHNLFFFFCSSSFNELSSLPCLSFCDSPMKYEILLFFRK